MKRRGWIILAAVAAACLLFFGFVVYKVATMPPMFPPYNFASGFENPKEFQKEVGMRVGCKLPPSVRRVHFWHDGGKDPTEWIAFTVDAGDLPAIKAQIDSGPWTTAMPELPPQNS